MAIATPVPAPTGYPAEFEEHITLADGRRVFIRPVVPGDRTELAFELENADPETLYHRFFRAAVRIDDELLTHLTVLDYERRFAVAAFSGPGIAIARYEATHRTGEAEIAVAVKPGWRRLGLGTLLLRRLETAARARGVSVLRADFLADNIAAGALIANAGYGPPVYEHGIGSVEMSLI